MAEVRRLKNYKPTRFKAPGSVYRERMADSAVLFINHLRHGIGKWHGMPFELIDWQEQIIRDLFGVVRQFDDCRQFRKAYIELPKKNGKSELAAAVALLLTCCDFEYGGFVYGCATDRQQASIVFDVALHMVEQFPELKRHMHLQPALKKMTFKPLNSYYQVISAESGNKDGYNAHGIIFDELHAQKTPEFFNRITRSSGITREQPLQFYITTAGFDRNSVCYEVHKKAAGILRGTYRDPTFYPVIYGADEKDDWTDPEIWKKANPSFNILIDPIGFRAEFQDAKASTTNENIFRMQNLNQWVKQWVRWMPMDVWDQCDFRFDPDDLKKRDCYGGLDLSATTDMTAFVLIFPPQHENDKYCILPHFWIPEENMHARVKKDHVPYQDWVGEKLLETTPGNIMDYSFVQAKIEELGRKYRIRQIGFDEWGAHQMSESMKNAGFEVIRIPQSFQGLSPPSIEMYRLVQMKKIAHNAHPILRWNFDNVVMRLDAGGNIRPDKEKATEKIDGAVAAIMALDLAIKQAHKKSAYEDRGIIAYGAEGFITL